MELSKKINPDNKNIIIVHTGIGGNFIPGCTKSEVIDLFKDKVVYIAGGHLHTFKYYPKNNPFFFVPGCPEYWDLNEKENKGYIIFDTETNEYQFFESKKRKVSDHSLNSDNIYEKIDDINVEEGEIIKLKLLNNSSPLIDTDDLEQKLIEKGALKVIINISYESIKNNINDIRNLNKKNIEEMVIESWKNTFSVNSSKTIEYLDILKTKVNEKSQDIFDSFDHFLDLIIEGENNED